MKRDEMEKYEAIDFILKFQWWGMFIICTSGGVIANESFLRLNNAHHVKWKNFFPKLSLAFFICTLIHAIYETKELNPKTEYACILLASFLHLPIAIWIRDTLWPILSNSLIRALGGKKDV